MVAVLQEYYLHNGKLAEFSLLFNQDLLDELARYFTFASQPSRAGLRGVSAVRELKRLGSPHLKIISLNLPEHSESR